MDPVSISAAARAAAQGSLGVALGAGPGGGSASAPEVPFASMIRGAVEEANEALVSAEEHGAKLATGEADIVETMVALGKADLSLRFVVAMRNRALEAYNEIMRLQV